MLVKAYGSRNLYPLFKKGTEHLLATLKNSEYRDMFYYKEMMELKKQLLFSSINKQVFFKRRLFAGHHGAP